MVRLWVASLPPPLGVVWCCCGLLPPSLWCGVVRVWALVVLPLPPLWRGVGWVVPPVCLDLLGVFGKPMLMMILMMMMTIIMIIIITIILVFLWLVVGYLLPTCLLTIIALLTVGAHRVAMGQLSQGSGLSENVVHVTAALFKTLMSESSFGKVYSHMRRDPGDS